MDKGIVLDGRMAQFLDRLHIPVTNIEECEENVKKALAMIADDVRLGRAELLQDAPPSKLRSGGAHHRSVLYDRGQDVGEDMQTVCFHLPDRGMVTISLYPWGEEAFSEEEKRMHNLLAKEVFAQYSRVIMQGFLMHVMNTDMATGVSNVESFMQFVVGLMQRQVLEKYRVLFFNIHNFKYVNKVFPYAEGDVILRKYAQHVKQATDENELVARLGGDNFVAIIRKEHAQAFVEMLRNIKIIHVAKGKKKEFVFGATIGVGTLEGVDVPREVMARASIAYQAARLRGVGTVAYYSDEIQKQLMETQSIISNFVPALEKGEFIVYYQSKVNIKDKTICGAEALVRWFHDGRLIPPMQFIPQLEREGSVCKLDYYVLEQACKFLKGWIEKGEKPVCISVNFSRRHLEEDNLVEQIVEIVDRYGVDHKYIEIELTESEDFQNYEIMSNIVNGLRDNGIGTSIDDFGTGFSSLNMIKQVDLNVIKIDKSFIPLESEYPDKKKDMVMFGSIVKLVKQLGKKTIAEGVETTEQLEYLKQVGCDIVQGYVFDKPLPQAEFEQRLKQGYE